MRDIPSRPAAVLFALGAAAFSLGSATPTSPTGSAHAVAPPPGHTGGFGEPTCLICHQGAPINLPGGEVSVRGLPDAYRPGEAYTLTVVLESEEMGAAGFQLSARHADGSQAGSFQPVDDRVAVTRGPGGVGYAHQTDDGSHTPDPVRVSWSLAWTAPASGTVTFHLAANSGNGDDSPLSDLVYATSSTLEAEQAR